MKRAAVVSLHFSPGLLSHICAHSMLFSSLGYDSKVFLDSGYGTMEAEISVPFAYYSTPEELANVDVVLIYNLSKRDLPLIRSLGKQSLVLFMYHEPYGGVLRGLRPLLRGRNSLNDTIRHFGRHLFSVSTLKSVDRVLLPSPAAVNAYKTHDVKYNSSFIEFPLIFSDESFGVEVSERQYFSYIGSAVPDHGFQEFLDFMAYASRVRPLMRFQIVTRSSVRSMVEKRFTSLIEDGRLVLDEGHPHSNLRMNKAYASSICVWFCYRRSTQSGVLCKAFMNSTPGIATHIGSFPEYINDSNGIIIDDACDSERLLSAFDSINDMQEEYSLGARNTFLEKFYYRQFIEDFRIIVDGC